MTTIQAFKIELVFCSCAQPCLEWRQLPDLWEHVTTKYVFNPYIILVSLERGVYIRERLSKSYTSSAYFWGRATAELPILVMFPILLSVLVYFPNGLNLESAGKYFIFRNNSPFCLT